MEVVLSSKTLVNFYSFTLFNSILHCSFCISFSESNLKWLVALHTVCFNVSRRAFCLSICFLRVAPIIFPDGIDQLALRKGTHRVLRAVGTQFLNSIYFPFSNKAAAPPLGKMSGNCCVLLFIWVLARSHNVSGRLDTDFPWFPLSANKRCDGSRIPAYLI